MLAGKLSLAEYPIDTASQSDLKGVLHNSKFTCNSFGSIIFSVKATAPASVKSQDAFAIAPERLYSF